MERQNKPIVAICLLTVGDIHPFLTKSFETTEFQTHFRLFIHPKFENRVNPTIRKYCIPAANRVQTKWGHVSLVSATLSLMYCALQNPEIDYIILLSENHIPLYTWDELWKLIKVEWEEGKGRMNIHKASPERWSSFQRPPIVPFHLFYKHSQWLSFTRQMATFFVFPKYNYTQQFAKMLAPDEHYFITTLIHHRINADSVFLTHSTTFVSFPPKNTGHPSIFNSISLEYINKLKDQKYWFFRKVSTDCLFPVKFLQRFFHDDKRHESNMPACDTDDTDELIPCEIELSYNSNITEAPPIFGGVVQHCT